MNYLDHFLNFGTSLLCLCNHVQFILCAFYGGLYFFFRCSPNVAHWAVLEFDSALANLPLCYDFCDSWFEACADDTTCAVNWITDWLYVDGANYCKDDAECLSYRYVCGLFSSLLVSSSCCCFYSYQGCLW